VPTPPSTSSEFVRVSDQLVNWLNVGEKRSRWLQWAFALAAALYLVFVAIAQTGPIARYGHDAFLFLDGGWRILNGQMPYRDFNLPLGPLEYLIITAGMLITNASPQGIAIGNAAVGLTVGIWGWSLSRRRMPVIPALLVTAWLILTATAPSPLGYATPFFPSCAMIYNRHGYALLALVIVECTFANERSTFAGGVSSGIALALMAFLKLNFFGFAGLFLLASVPIRREEMPRVWGCLAAFACATAAFALYLRSAIPAFVADMTLAIRSRESRMGREYFFGGPGGGAEMLILTVLTLVVVFLIARDKLRRPQALRILLVGSLVIASRPFFRLTNSGETGFQLAALWMIVLAAALLMAYGESKVKVAIAAVIGLSFAGFFVGIFPDARSVQTLARFTTPSVKAQGFSCAGVGVDRLKFYDIPGNNTLSRFDNGHFLVDQVNDGTALLQKFSSQNESVFALGYRNPFSYLLRRKPALGGSTLLQLDYNFSEKWPLEADAVFGNADLIMVPTYPSPIEPSNTAIVDIYRPYLLQHFAFVASSQSWSLYRRIGVTQHK
jgi:hypothetical protein